MRNLIAAFAVALLTACGGGDPEDLADAGPSAEARARPVRGVFYGDSTQMGYTYANAVLYAQKRLDHTGDAVEIWQEGVGGSTAQELLTGTDGRHTEHFAQTLAGVDAQFVGFRYGNPDHQYYRPATFQVYLERLVNIAEGAGKVVILQTPSPLSEHLWDTERNRLVQRNVHVIREVAAAHPNAVLCDHRRVGMVEGFENVDGVHPTPEDYRLRQGPTLARCIRQALAKMR